jgi:hypothetical protein
MFTVFTVLTGSAIFILGAGCFFYSTTFFAWISYIVGKSRREAKNAHEQDESFHKGSLMFIC